MPSQVYVQIYHFFIFAIAGTIISISFDIFRIFRRSFKTPDFVTILEDIIFWILTGLFLIYIILRFNDGEIRGYIFAGILFGVIIYLLTFSRYFIKYSVLLITKIKCIIISFIKSIIKLYTRFIFNPFHFVVINIKKILVKFSKKS